MTVYLKTRTLLLLLLEIVDLTVDDEDEADILVTPDSTVEIQSPRISMFAYRRRIIIN